MKTVCILCKKQIIKGRSKLVKICNKCIEQLFLEVENYNKQHDNELIGELYPSIEIPDE